MKHRQKPLDWLRGIVMVLMVTDHASEAFNAARPLTDSAVLPGFDQPLAAGQFLFRWLSHLCAPVFVFLAGTGLALSIARKQQRGATPGSIDRDLVLRGLLLLGVEVLVINLFWEPGVLLLQVLYAIGLSMIFMVVLRRLADAQLLTLALAASLLGEWLGSGGMMVEPALLPVTNALLFRAGVVPVPLFGFEVVFVAYPVVPWCAMMALGWLFGRCLMRRVDALAGASGSTALARTLVLLAAVCLLVFAVLRAANGFGNLSVLRLDHSLVQWLHVSKYPPSLTFTALELGLMFLLLAGLFRLPHAADDTRGLHNPLLVFGQTAFFFYLAHIAVLETVARATGLYQRGNLGHAMLAAVAVLVVLYPLCLGYRRLKAHHRHSVLRYF